MRSTTSTILTLAAGAALSATITLSNATAQKSADPDVAEISAALTDFHDAASKSDLQRYFGHFAEQGMFLGTDKSERWTAAEFREYAAPYFEADMGWTYVLEDSPGARSVVVSKSGGVAWFDERLQGAKYGSSRGTGTMVFENGAWKIAQYHLSFPIPNEMAPEMTTLIKQYEAEQERLKEKVEKAEQIQR